MHRYGVKTTRSTLTNFENGLRDDITFSAAIAMVLRLGEDGGSPGLAGLVLGDPAEEHVMADVVRVGETQLSPLVLRVNLVGRADRQFVFSCQQLDALIDQLTRQKKESLVAALAETMDPRFRALIVSGAGSGMRISEAPGLTVDRIDFLRRTITVDRQLLRGSGRSPVFGPGKDRHNTPRTIAVGSVVLDALAEHLARYRPRARRAGALHCLPPSGRPLHLGTDLA